MKKRTIVTAMFLTAALSLMAGCGQKVKTINMNDYFSYELSGYDGYAKIDAKYDSERLIRDVSGVLDLESLNKDDLSQFFIALQAMQGEWDKSEELSNGDQVTYSWKFDKDMFREKYNVVFKYEDVKQKVKDLKEVTTYDAFADVSYELTGIAPYGKLSVVNKKHPELTYELSRSDHLQNGDTVTVGFKETASVDKMMQIYGAIPVGEEITYSVSGLAEYADAVSDLSADLKKQLEKTANDFVTATYAGSTEKTLLEKEPKILGYYLLSNKNSSTSGNHNELYLIYSTKFESRGNGVTETVLSYKYLRFTDVLVYEDGSCYVDLTKYGYPVYNRFGNSEAFSTASGMHAGYTSLDLLYNQCIASKLMDFTVDTDL